MQLQYGIIVVDPGVDIKPVQSTIMMITPYAQPVMPACLSWVMQPPEFLTGTR